MEITQSIIRSIILNLAHCLGFKARLKDILEKQQKEPSVHPCPYRKKLDVGLFLRLVCEQNSN